MDKLINGEQKDLWTQIMSNELVRLAQVNGAVVKANDCVDVINHKDSPNDINMNYANFVCDYRPLKSDQYRIRLVVG